MLACVAINRSLEENFEMDSYIIRIYRRDTDHLESVLGVLEATSDGSQRSFQSRDELWNLLVDSPMQVKSINKGSKLKVNR
ncbi:MAG: hypothetical protein ACI88G_001301 [Woeseiaceae bacterium]|jgi:hypothetical protein